MIYKKALFTILICCFIQACSKVDDYVLGKDNTPKPKSLPSLEKKTNLKEKWSRSVGNGTRSAHYLKLKPIVKQGIVYTADASGLIQATDLNSAQPIWIKKLSHGIISGPAVENGVLAVGTDAATVVLLNQNNGVEIWSKQVSGDVLSMPVIAQDKVIVKTINGNLYGLNLKNGSQLWVADHGAPNLILKASSSPVVLDKMAVVGFSDGKLDAVDLETGALLWQRGIAYASGSSDVERLVDIDADPIIRGSIAYLATYQGYIGAFSLNDGQFIWRKPASTFKNIVADDHALYLADSDDVVWAYDLKDGHVRWKQPALKARALTEPALMGNQLVIGDKTGLLHVLSTKNGEFLSRTQLNSPIYNAPTISGKNIYIMTGNGHLNKFAVS